MKNFLDDLLSNILLFVILKKVFGFLAICLILKLVTLAMGREFSWGIALVCWIAVGILKSLGKSKIERK